jgi:hypothetical protein
MVQDDGPGGLDGVEVAFDDQRVADAGVVLVATLAGAAEDREPVARLRGLLDPLEELWNRVRAGPERE